MWKWWCHNCLNSCNRIYNTINKTLAGVLMQAYACSCIYIPSSPYNVCLTVMWTNVGHLTRVMQWVLAANQGFIQGFSLREAANIDDLLLAMPLVSLSLRRISGLAWICHTVSWQQANWEKNIHFINFTFLGKCRGPHSPPPTPTSSTWTVQNSLDNADTGMPFTQDCLALRNDSPTGHYTNTGTHSSSLWLAIFIGV